MTSTAIPSPKGETLKPCPFCGGDAEVGGYDYAYYARCMDRGCIAGVHAIHFEDDAAARDAWNRRSTSSSEDVRREALEEAAKVILAVGLDWDVDGQYQKASAAEYLAAHIRALSQKE